MNSAYRATLFAVVAAAANAQVSNNASLSGKYFFRQVVLLTTTSAAGGSASISQTQSAWGSLTFDGLGGLAVSASQLAGTTPSTTLSGTGTYTVNPGGLVTLSNPLLPGVTINARLGAENLLVGSSTEAGPNTFDLLIAMRGPVNPVTNRSLSGAYWISSLEFPNGGGANVRDTNFKLTADGQGGLGQATVTGQANNLGNTLLTQTVGPISYLLNSDGSGTMTIPAAAGLNSATQLIEGVETIYLSQDGSFFIGGSTAAGGHGLIVGVSAFAGGVASSATNASWNGLFFAAGLRYDTPSGALTAVTGSVNPTSQGAVWERRTHQSSGVSDATLLLPYSLTADGSGTYTSTQAHVDLASNGVVFSTSGSGAVSSTGYELYFGASILAQSATSPGPFLQPLGIFNAASYAPPGLPVSPGEFVALFGNGFSQNSAQALIPYPPFLGNVQVTVNGNYAPLYVVSPTQINAVVPYAVTGSTATFVVLNNNVPSNAVTVPLAATAPGVFSLSANGLGSGAVLHADSSIVNQASPAVPGEIVEVYLTGLGAVSPSVSDGTAAPGKPSYAIVTSQVSASVGGIQVSNIQFQGLSPGLASLYQLNLQIPSAVGPGLQALEIQTPAGSTDIVDVWIGP